MVTDNEIDEWIAALEITDGLPTNNVPLIELLKALKDERQNYGPTWRARAEGAEEAEKDLREALRSVHAKLDHVNQMIADRLHTLEDVL